jgi:hypothetical protein
MARPPKMAPNTKMIAIAGIFLLMSTRIVEIRDMTSLHLRPRPFSAPFQNWIELFEHSAQ